eukprot:g6877.t1
MCVADGIQHRKKSFELFGYDFMIGDGLHEAEVWLIEVNSSPACDYSTPVTCPLVKQMMEDLAKVVVDLKEDPNACTGEWQPLQHCHKPVPGRMGFASSSQLEVIGKKMKVPGKAKKKKRKSSKKPSQETDECAFPEEDDEEDPEP